MKTNSYALVTGASLGLGRAISFELAKRQINLLLVALPASGLKELADFIGKQYEVDVHYLERDLSFKESCRDIVKYIQSNDIQLKYLINNAGILSRGYFDESSIDYVTDQIKVNVMAPTYLTHELLDNLRVNSPGAILNVSSLAGFFPLPVKQVYCGTKSFLNSFSQSLKWELMNDNITVSILCPGGLNTTTRLCVQNRRLSWFNRLSILEPEVAAKIAVDGMFKGKEIIVPGWVNRFYIFLDRVLPARLKKLIIVKEMKQIGLTRKISELSPGRAVVAEASDQIKMVV